MHSKASDKSYNAIQYYMKDDGMYEGGDREEEIYKLKDSDYFDDINQVDNAICRCVCMVSGKKNVPNKQFGLLRRVSVACVQNCLRSPPPLYVGFCSIVTLGENNYGNLLYIKSLGIFESTDQLESVTGHHNGMNISSGSD